MTGYSCLINDLGEIDFTTAYRVGGIVLAAPLVASCAASVEVPATPAIPSGYEISFVGMQTYDLGQDVSTWSEDMGLDAWDNEQLYVGLYDNGINTKTSYKIKYNGTEYTYNFFYSSENKYNHIVPDAEEFIAMYQFIFDVYSQYYGEGEFGIIRSANLFWGKDWQFLDRSMTYLSTSGAAYSFVKETTGESPVDREFMELIHTLLMDVNNTSFHVGRESFAGSLSILVNSCRLQLPYRSSTINNNNYLNRVQWARTLNLSVPDPNDYSKTVPIEVIEFPEEIYNAAMSICGKDKFSYERPKAPNQDSQSQFIEEGNRQVVAMAKAMRMRGLEVRKRDLQLWERELAAEYLVRFPNASIEDLVEAGYTWLRYGAI